MADHYFGNNDTVNEFLQYLIAEVIMTLLTDPHCIIIPPTNPLFQEKPINILTTITAYDKLTIEQLFNR